MEDIQWMYVETVSDEALDLSEDLANLQVAKACISRLSTNLISKDERYEVLNKISEFDRTIRYYMRRTYLEGNTGKVYNSIRQRAKEELIKEGYNKF